MKPRQNFINNLDEVTSYVFRLSNEVEKRIDKLIHCIEHRNVDALKDISKEDIVVNDLELLINEKIISLITLEAPVASDLRMLISYIKIAEDLERVADNVVNIANVSAEYNIGSEEIINKFKSMLQLSKLMLSDATVAMETKDLALIKELLSRDEDIDMLYIDTTSEAIEKIEDKVIMSQVVLIAKYIERIGDHVENISEHLYYY
ncbi:phosphate signaling complex protein PhoU, partial [Nosocomiicoccus massiliensis]|uniref:phosphate signaling complex protein PhoU n=2 Tax=Nosocomiicoccus TaxID=489909 RepID=UPI000593A337